jgi:hypothetical protein
VLRTFPVSFEEEYHLADPQKNHELVENAKGANHDGSLKN